MQPKQRSWFRGMVTGALPVAGLITMLLALVFLQLRWSARVSNAERGRLQQNLQRSTSGFQSAFAQDLLAICQAFQSSQPRPLPVLAERWSDRYTVLRRISRHPALIGNLYLWSISSNTLQEFKPGERRLEAVAWPEPLRKFANRSITARNDPLLPRRPRRWVWDESIPALVHPVYTVAAATPASHPQLFGYLLVVFNPAQFEQVYLPELGQRHFPVSNGFVFQVIERDRGNEQQVIYQSGPHASTAVFSHPDAIFPLLPAPLLEGPIRYPGETGPASSPVGASALAHQVFLSAAATQKWRIAVRHRSGSVDGAVVSLRRRDFALSIIVLAMLIVSLITILAATRRARRLARLQMEFASGVSHELRTPLAVISSAAENLADGVVTGGDQIREYGALIHRESQRLSGMVDHILDFAELDSQATSNRMETVSPAEAIEAVLANERPRIEAAGIAVHMDIPAEIPMVLTDPQVLQQCLQNLVGNALKYGSGGGRIVLAVSNAREEGEERVLIRVQDFGTGIAAEDLPHIFEPFYRAAKARDSQIPGTGLGLSLTRKMIEGMGGQITVESAPGKGSAFTLRIPAAGEYRPREERFTASG